MEELLCIVQPFTVVQTIYKINDNSSQEIAQCSINNLTNTFLTLSKENNIKIIHLMGDFSFIEKFGEELKNTSSDITVYYNK